MKRDGVLLVVAGPSGVGKGTLIQRLLQQQPQVSKSVSCTTRSPRPGEVAGEDYLYVSREEFDRLRQSEALLEWAVVHQDLFYGTPRQPVEEALAQGQDIVLEIDYQGARSVRKILGERAILVFVAPPSWESLVGRLRGRQTESDQATAKRLASAIHEFAHVELFDYLLINDDLERAVMELQAILLSERARLDRLHWRPFIDQLLKDAGQ